MHSTILKHLETMDQELWIRNYGLETMDKELWIRNYGLGTMDQEDLLYRTER